MRKILPPLFWIVVLIMAYSICYFYGGCGPAQSADLKIPKLKMGQPRDAKAIDKLTVGKSQMQEPPSACTKQLKELRLCPSD